MFEHKINIKVNFEISNEELIQYIKQMITPMQNVHDPEPIITLLTPHDVIKMVMEADHSTKISKGAYSIYHDKFNDMPSLLNAETPDTIIMQSDLRKLIEQFIELSNFGEQPITPEYIQQKMQAASRLLKESDWEAADSIIKHVTKELLLSIKHGRCTNVQECIKQLGY